MKNQLDHNKDQLKTIVANLPGMTYRIKNERSWEVIFISEKCKELTGYDVTDFTTNKSLNYNQIIHKDDKAYVWDTVQKALSEHTSYELEYRIIRADGVEQWVWESGSGVFDENKLLYLDGIIIGNDKRKKNELALIESERKFRAVFSQVAVGAARIDLNGQWLEVNKKLCEIVGYSQKELLSRTFQDITHPDDLQMGLSHLKSLISNEIQNYTTNKRYIKKGGEVVWVNIAVSVVRDLNNKPEYFIAVIQDISSQKEDQKNLKESENMFHALFEQAGGYCMILDPNTSDGVPLIVDANEAAYKEHGYSREEFIGRRVSDVDDDEGKLLVKKRTAEIMTGKTFFIQNTHVRKDGSSFPVAVNAKRIDIDGKKPLIFTTEYDITELKQKELELKVTNENLIQKKNELETIIEIAPYPIAIHSEDGNVKVLNKAWSDYSGYTLDDIGTVDDFIRLMVTEEMKDKIKKIGKSLYFLNEHDEAVEHSLLTKDGHKVIWQFSSAPLGLIDGKRTVITSAIDITELKKKDEMLLNQSRHAAMGEMIGIIAHQWRQPLSSISMDANNMLVDIEMDEFCAIASKKYANNISKQIQHLSETIDDFRNFFKPDKAISTVYIKDILNHTLSIVTDSLRNNAIEFKSFIDPGIQVDTYPRELMQVFVNIVTNAKDALVSNKVNDALIVVRAYENIEYIDIEICDNGGGIDADILSKVFDPYFSTKDEKTGTGLGLYMSKMIIEDHLNGILNVENKEKGACFTVKLVKPLSL